MNGKQKLYSVTKKVSNMIWIRSQQWVWYHGFYQGIEKQHLAKVSALKSKVQDYNSDFSKQVIFIVTEA